MRSIYPRVRQVFATLLAASTLTGLTLLPPTTPPIAAAEAYGACTPGIRSLTDYVRAGARPSGALVLGMIDPNQVYTVAAGARIVGDIYLFNGATLKIGTGQAQIAGNVFVLDHSTVQVTGADLTIPSTHADGYRWLATDDAKVNISDSRVTLGTSPGIYNSLMACGRSRVTILRTDFGLMSGAIEALFAWETGGITLVSSLGNIEISVDHGGQVSIADQHQAAAGHTVVYFSVRGILATPIKLVSGAGVTESIAFPPDSLGRIMTATIQASDILFALRVDPGANFTLSDAVVAILLTSSGTSTMHDLVPGHFANQTVDLGDRKVGLLNTDVWLWNAYLDGSTGSLDVHDAFIGELICTSTGAATCRTQRVLIDGSGGFVSATGAVQMLLDSSMISTYITALDTSTVRLRQSLVVKAPAGGMTPFVQSSQSSLVVFENSGYDPTVALLTSENGAIANATIEGPVDGTALSRGPVAVRGTAEVRSALASPNAFVGYALTAVPTSGGPTVRVGSGSAAVQSNVLGTWNTVGLAAGTYDLHLILSGKSGTIADVSRRVNLS